MPIFDKITLTFRGQDHVIPAHRVMPALAAIEDVITLARMSRAMASGDLPLLRISQAYAVALQHAGARVTPEEVYAEMFANEGELRERAIEALGTLQVMMIPPEHLRRKASEVDAAAGKDQATGQTASDSSPRSTSSSSATPG
jgi:hypothetical protein